MGNPALIIYPNKCAAQRSFYLLINAAYFHTSLLFCRAGVHRGCSVPGGSGYVASSQACQALKNLLGSCREHPAYVEDRGIVKYQLFNERMASNLPPLLFKKKKESGEVILSIMQELLKWF